MPFGGRILRPVSGGSDAQPASGSSAGLFSLTYEPYYGLVEKPFSLSADPRFLFRSREHAPAFDDLLNGIRRREGLITLTGEIGTGKTTLIRAVLQHLDRRTFSSFVPDPFVSREDLLKKLLVDFGVVSIADLKRGSLHGASRTDLSYPLYEFLDSLAPLQAFAVLIIDEAQNLPLPLLEEVRILSDLEGREKLLQVVLVGQPELRGHLKLPELRQVDQRVSVRCELTPLDADGVRGYIEHRLHVAGEGHPSVEFSREAIDAVYEGSKGTPRLINLICDRALHRGYTARAPRIEPAFVWDAIRDLGLEVTPPAPAAPTRPAPGTSAPTAPAPAPAPAPQVQSAEPRTSAVPAPDGGPKPTRPKLLPPPADAAPPTTAPVPRSAIPVPRSDREMLTDFEPEQTAHVTTPASRGWMLAGASALLALAAAGGMLAYLRLEAATDISRLELPAPPARAVATLPAIVPEFAIQVASFQTNTRAQRVVQQLTRSGYRARAVAVDNRLGRRFVTVLVGNYMSEHDAARDLASLRQQHGYLDARVEVFVGPAIR